MKKTFLFLVILVFATSLHAQRSALDSLRIAATKVRFQPKSSGRDTLLIKTLNEIGRINVDINADSAIYYIDSAYKIQEKVNWEKGWAYCFRAKGIYLAEQGNYAEASDYLFKSLKLFEKYHEIQKLGNVLMSLGLVFSSQGDYSEAIKYHQKSIQVLKKIGYSAGILSNYNNIGDAYLQAKMYNQALQYFKLYKDLLSKGKYHNQSERECVNAINLSICFYGLNDAKSGKFYEDIAVNLAKKNNAVYEQYILFEELAKCFEEQGKFQKAVFYAESSLPFAQQLRSYDKISRVYKLLYKANKVLGNQSKALSYFEKHYELEDSLKRVFSLEKVKEIQLKYDVEHKQNEINSLKLENLQQEQNQRFIWFGASLTLLLVTVGAIFWNNFMLRKKNEQLELKNKEISEALLKGQTLERKRVAAELHDNIGGTIAAMRLQMYGLDKSKFTEVELNNYNDILAMIQESYKQIRGLSHNLMPEVLEKDGLIGALERLVEKMNFGGLVELSFINVNIVERLKPQQELELYSICLELVNNIIKHSKATKAEIMVEKVNNHIELQISDNGKGFDANETENGMGIYSVSNRVKSLKGTWNIQSEKEQGTTIFINVPC